MLSQSKYEGLIPAALPLHHLKLAGVAVGANVARRRPAEVRGEKHDVRIGVLIDELDARFAGPVGVVTELTRPLRPADLHRTVDEVPGENSLPAL